MNCWHLKVSHIQYIGFMNLTTLLLKEDNDYARNKIKKKIFLNVNPNS